jgi:hypothetical protein
MVFEAVLAWTLTATVGHGAPDGKPRGHVVEQHQRRRVIKQFHEVPVHFDCLRND